MMGVKTAHNHSTEIHPSSSSPYSHSHSHSHSSSIHSRVSTSDHMNFPGPPTSTSSPLRTRWSRILTPTLLILTFLSIALAAAVVGCHAHALNLYNSTNLDESFFLPPIWPVGEAELGLGLDLRPTQGMLVGAAVTALAGGIYVCWGSLSVCGPRRFRLVVILLSLSVSILGLAGAVFGIAYATYISSRPGDERDDLTSWTCRWVDGAERVDRMFENGLAELAAPQGFKRVCVETKVGFVLLAVLVGVESLVVILTGLRAWVEVRVRRGERDDGEEGDGVVDYGEKGGVGRDAY